MREAAILVLLLSAVTGLSQFYRVSNSVIGPEVAVELGLSARELGLAGGAFFLALFVAQIPVGMAFDRWGARATITTVSGLAVLGALWIARSGTAGELIAARFVVGLGCSASFMSAVFLCSYLTHKFLVGPKTFPVCSMKPWYLAMLTSHTILAVAVVPLVIRTIVLARRGDFEGHKRWARWTLPIWAYVSVTGVLVYFMLYQM